MNKTYLLLVWTAAGLVFCAAILCVSAMPKRGTVENHLVPAEKHIVKKGENIRENLTKLKTLSPEERKKIAANYVKFHKLPKAHQKKVIKNYLDWLQYEDATKQELIGRYKNKEIRNTK